MLNSYKMLFLTLLMTSFSVNSMEKRITKQFFSLVTNASNSSFCDKMRALANLLLMQDKILHIARQNIECMKRVGLLDHKAEKYSFKKELLSDGDAHFYFQFCPETELGVHAGLSLTKFIRVSEFKRTDLPKVGDPGYRFLFAHDPALENNPDIQRLRDIIFTKLELQESSEDAISNVRFLRKMIENISLHLGGYEEEFKVYCGYLKSVKEILFSYLEENHASRVSLFLGTNTWNAADDDAMFNKFIEISEPIIENYFLQRAAIAELYQNIVHKLQLIVLGSIKNKMQCPLPSWTKYTDCISGGKLPKTFESPQVDSKEKDAEVCSKGKNKQHQQQTTLSTKKTSNKKLSKKRKPKKNKKNTRIKCAPVESSVEVDIPSTSETVHKEIVDDASDLYNWENLEEQDELEELLTQALDETAPASSDVQIDVQRNDALRSSKEKLVHDEKKSMIDGDDQSYVIGDETTADQIVIADPKNNMKLCLYRTDPLNPVAQNIDRMHLWKNYSNNVKKWFVDNNTALQEQGYLDPLNTKRYVKTKKEAGYTTRIHSFALVVDEFIKSLGNQHHIDSRLIGQKEKDLCITIPGHFEDLDGKDRNKRTCLFVFLQNGLTKKWYHRMIEEKSKHLLVEEYLRDGYHQVVFPPLSR